MKVIKKKYTKTNCRRHTTYYYQLLLLRPSKSKGRSSKKGKIHTISCAKLLYFTKKNLLQRLQKKNLCKGIEFELSKKETMIFHKRVKSSSISPTQIQFRKKLDTHMELQMLVLDTIVNSIIKKKLV